jgi:hypothetical protein
MSAPHTPVAGFHLWSNARPIPEPDIEPYHPVICLLIGAVLGAVSWGLVFLLAHWISKAIAQAAFDAATICGAC